MPTKAKTPKRTKAGTVTAKAREEHGNARGAFPIFDKQSADAALKLRGHAKTEEERKDVVRRAAKYDKPAAKRASQVDKPTKKGRG